MSKEANEYEEKNLVVDQIRTVDYAKQNNATYGFLRKRHQKLNSKNCYLSAFATF